MEEYFKLSIAIPTFNGEEYLALVLDNIINQIEITNEKIEVLISDNASTDNTKFIVSKYKKKFSFISYYINKDNFGPDVNYDLAVRKAKGKFVWLLSDNDLILNDGIRKVCQIIDSYPSISAIFLNFVNSPIKSDDGEFLCINSEDFFLKTFFANAFVSSNVINKSLWLNVDTKKFYNSNWIHFCTLAEGLINKQSFVVYKKYLKMIAPYESAWIKDSSNFLINGIDLAIIIKNMRYLGYKKNIIFFGVRILKKGFTHNLISLKIKGLKINKKILKKSLYAYSSFLSYWFIDLFLMLLPNFFYKFSYSIFKYFRAINK